MDVSMHDVNAYVRGEKDGVYSLKIEIFDIGIYLNGATIRKSKRDNGWWLQPPKHVRNGKYFADIEFDTTTELWKEMLNASMDAVNEWRRNHGLL